MAETITLGKVSVSPKGAYSSTTSYTFLDAVSHNGGAFLCLQNSTGVEPGVSSGWQSYWMETSKGIKQISVSSAQEGQATITVTLSDGTVSTVTFDTGVVVAQTGEGPPTTATVAAYIGQLYIDTTAAENPVYICVGITTADNVTSYVWQPVGGTIEDGSITADMLADDAIPDALGFNPGMVNPNLIDNWYFVGGGSQQGGGQFPINQRGQTSYSGAGYSIDRWYLRADTEAEIVEDGLVVSVSGEGSRAFNQRLEGPENYLGKTLTYSVLIEENTADGAIIFNMAQASNVGTNTLPVEEFDIPAGQTGLFTTTFTVPTELQYPGLNVAFYFRAACSVGSSIKIKAVKLELGSQQTLAHQENGVWVLNEIPDYGEQLARCQRYFCSIKPKGNWLVGDVMANNTAFCTLKLPLSVPMRTTPSISVSSLVYSRSGADAGASPTSVSVISTINNEVVQANILLGGSFTTGEIYAIIVKANGELILSADL